MEISLELLFHFRCRQCNRRWRTHNALPTHLLQIHCPRCGRTGRGEEINYGNITEENQNQAANLAQLLENIAAELRATRNRLED
jgi:phage FluMu protein Com